MVLWHSRPPNEEERKGKGKAELTVGNPRNQRQLRHFPFFSYSSFGETARSCPSRSNNRPQAERTRVTWERERQWTHLLSSSVHCRRSLSFTIFMAGETTFLSFRFAHPAIKKVKDRSLHHCLQAVAASRRRSGRRGRPGR